MGADVNRRQHLTVRIPHQLQLAGAAGQGHHVVKVQRSDDAFFKRRSLDVLVSQRLLVAENWRRL
jgi:flagellar hook-associated protein FlgK